MIANITEIVVGIFLCAAGVTGRLDAFWSGMGTALIVVGTLQLLWQIRYRNDHACRENVDISVSDERNKYLSMKAWSWAGYYFVLIAAAASIVLKIAGYDALVPVTSGSVCLIMVLYWLSWMYLRRKY